MPPNLKGTYRHAHVIAYTILDMHKPTNFFKTMRFLSASVVLFTLVNNYTLIILLALSLETVLIHAKLFAY